MTPARMAEIHAAAFAPKRGWSAAEFETLCASDTVVCHASGAGFALIRTIEEEAELLTLAVHPDAQRRGLARAIMTDWLRHTPAHRAFLEVAAENFAAIALYRNQGFTEVGRRPAYYRQPDGSTIDAVLMEAALTHRQSPQ